MKKTLLKTALLLAWVALVASSASAASTSTSTTISLGISAWSVTIWGPTTIDFWTGTVANDTVTKLIQMSTWNCAWSAWVSGYDYSYFWLEDLKSASSGYSTDIRISNLTDTWKVIDAAQVSASLTWWTTDIVSLDGLTWTESTRPTEITLSNHAVSWWPDHPHGTELSSSVSMIWRTQPTTPFSWIIWKYGFRPDFYIDIPKYQQLWSYKATITYTVVE